MKHQQRYHEFFFWFYLLSAALVEFWVFRTKSADLDSLFTFALMVFMADWHRRQGNQFLTNQIRRRKG